MINYHEIREKWHYNMGPAYPLTWPMIEPFVKGKMNELIDDYIDDRIPDDLRYGIWGCLPRDWITMRMWERVLDKLKILLDNPKLPCYSEIERGTSEPPLETK